MRKRKDDTFVWIFTSDITKNKWIENNCDRCYSIACKMRKEIKDGYDADKRITAISYESAKAIDYNPFIDSWVCKNKISEVL